MRIFSFRILQKDWRTTKASLDRCSSKHFSLIFFHVFNSWNVICLIVSFKILHITWNLLSIVSCTALPLSSKWNWRSVCMTPHYILQRERRWNEMKWDSAGTFTQTTATSISVALSQRERQKDSEYVFHLCDTQCSWVIGWLVPLWFFLSNSLACQTRESWSSTCKPLLFIYFLWIFYPPPSLILIYFTFYGSLQFQLSLFLIFLFTFHYISYL